MSDRPFRRKGTTTLYAKIKDVSGAWQQVPTPHKVGEEEAASAWIAARKKEIADYLAQLAGAPAVAAGPMTLRQFFVEWIKLRESLDLDWKNDRSRIRDHVLPKLGDMPIADIQPLHLVELFTWLRKAPLKSTGEPPAPRTIYNVYSSLSALFADARISGKVAQTPCILTERQLGEKVDKDRNWRMGAVFTREQVELIVYEPLLSPDRHVSYAIEFLAGLRAGETAGLQIKHYDRAKLPLHGLYVGDTYNTKKSRITGTKTGTEKYMPVTPELATILDRWIDYGWREMFGRAPTPDDLLVPIPPDHAKRRRSRQGTLGYRTHDYAGRRWREDLAMLELEHKRHHDTRATFITLCVNAGADEDTIKGLTHAKPHKTAFDGYVRDPLWKKSCDEVEKLVVRRPGAGPVQSSEVSETASDRSSGRRDSNPQRSTTRATTYHEFQDVEHARHAPNDTDGDVAAPRLVQAPCDVLMTVLEASLGLAADDD